MLIDRALAPNTIGAHSNVIKLAARYAAKQELDATDVIAKATAAGDSVKPYRDAYVVHRSLLNPRVLEGF